MLLMVCLFIGAVASVDAQVREVTGEVTSAEDGQPVIGASVIVSDTQIGAVTGINGNFVLKNVPASAKTLKVSYIGMKTQEVEITSDLISVIMQPDYEMMDEVVVTGYSAQRKASFTGASSVFGDDVLSKKTDANFVKSLEGAVPGVQMNNSTSMPGTWGSIYIRGRGSLSSGTQPLYVIDGMPVNSDYDGMSSGGNDWVDPMTSINPADIESVTVLKDAAATAIYGARAANGVIVVTTKKGSEGKLSVNLDIKQGYVSLGNNNQKYADARQTMNLFADGWTAMYGGSWNDNYAYLSDYYGWDGVSSYNWTDAIMRKGYYQDYNLSFQGRTGQTGYYMSLGYLDTKGLVINSDMERFSGRLNLDSKYKFVSFGVNTSYSFSTKNGFSQSVSGSFASPTVAAVAKMLPMYPFYDEEGNYAHVSDYNPLAVYDKDLGDIYQTKQTTLNLNPYVRVDFGRGIYAKSTLGVNIVDTREYNYWSAIYNPQGASYNGLGQQYNSKNNTITWTNILGWNYTFNTIHAVDFMFGQEMQRKGLFYDYYVKYDFPYASSGMRDLSTAGADDSSQYYQEEARLASYFIDAHYSYDDKYYVSASLRRDGSSVFGSNTRWGNFWSVGGKWRITGENFLMGNKILTNAALRASYGTVGNQDIGWYSARGFYTAGYNYGNVAGIVPTSIPNPNLTWETTKKFDAGLDLSFLGRVYMTLDYYNETTVDALYKVPLSMTTGLGAAYQNIGSIRNSGIEAAVNANIISNESVTWDFNVNLTWNENKVIRLANNERIEDSYTVIEEGRPYRQFYMKEYAGVDRETGKPLWYLDASGDETTSDYNAAAKRYLGSADPKLLGGFGTTVTWKGIDLGIDFKYRWGNKVLDTGAKFTGWGMNNMTPLKTVALNSWTEDNKDALYPQYIYGDPYNATAVSSRFLYNGGFLRINNITLGYTLPDKLTRKALLEKVRVYVSLDNAYTFTARDFWGYTPETYTSGEIAFQYPASRTFIGGVQITLF